MWEGLQKQVRWSRSDSGGSKGKILWTRAQGIRSWPVPEENIFLKSEKLILWSKLIPILWKKRGRNHCVSGIGRCPLDTAFTQRQNEQCHLKKHQESHICRTPCGFDRADRGLWTMKPRWQHCHLTLHGLPYWWPVWGNTVYSMMNLKNSIWHI